MAPGTYVPCSCPHAAARALLPGYGDGELTRPQPKERKGSRFFTEIRGGLAIFFAMAYIIAVNASIVSETGGTCVCNAGEADPICDQDSEYLMCIEEIRRDLVTATAAMAALSTFFMGLLANLCVPWPPSVV